MNTLFWLAGLATAHVSLVWGAAIRRGWQARRQIPKPVRPPDTWPSVSILIPAWQERDTIEPCLTALETTHYPGDWEALVIAGGPDGTIERARELCVANPRFLTLEQEPLGKNAALNRGFATAKGEVIALLDADSEVSPGWLRALVSSLEGTAQATTGNPQPFRWTPISAVEQMEHISAWEVRGVTTLQGSGGIALERKMIENLGGFPEDVHVGVDWDLDARLAALGVVRAFCPQAVIMTQRPATLGEYWRNEVRWRRAHLASLFRLPDHFLKGPMSALTNLYIYGLAWLALAFTAFALIAVLMWPAGIGRPAFVLWGLFVGWLLLRRAALAAEVTTYTQEWGWMKLVWAPPLLLIVTLAACIPATLTWRRQHIHFKGPRPERSAGADI